MKKIILSMMMVFFGIFSVEVSAKSLERIGEIILLDTKSGASSVIDYYSSDVVLAENKFFSQDNIVRVGKNVFLIKLNNHLFIERKLLANNRIDTLFYVNQNDKKEQVEIPLNVKYIIR